jgi:hypothetical protein
VLLNISCIYYTRNRGDGESTIVNFLEYYTTHGAEDPMVIILAFRFSNMPLFSGQLLCNQDVPDIKRKRDQKNKRGWGEHKS